MCQLALPPVLLIILSPLRFFLILHLFAFLFLLWRLALEMFAHAQSTLVKSTFSNKKQNKNRTPKSTAQSSISGCDRRLDIYQQEQLNNLTRRTSALSVNLPELFDSIISTEQNRCVNIFSHSHSRSVGVHTKQAGAVSSVNWIEWKATGVICGRAEFSLRFGSPGRHLVPGCQEGQWGSGGLA